MLDKNIVILEGYIGDAIKYKKTSEGKDCASFSLQINNFAKEFADATERTHSQTFIRIFVYDKANLDYLKSVDAKRGQRVSVFGRLTSFLNEYKGVTFMQNSIICRSIGIIKT